jgi:predicted metal-dependent hydrolase
MNKKKISYSKLRTNDSEITFRIKYSTRARYLRLQINPSTGLEVILPPKCKMEEAERFIYKKREWILKHLKNVSPKKEFTYLGDNIEIEQKYNLFLLKHKIIYHQNTIKIESPSGSDDGTRRIYNTWLKLKAKDYLPERTNELAQQNNFSFKQVRIRNQKTRWGSCSAGGNISLNYKLMKYRKEIIDYVIIHELCHLKEMNHSKRFWKLVEEIVPDYKNIKKELRAYSI